VSLLRTLEAINSVACYFAASIFDHPLHGQSHSLPARSFWYRAYQYQGMSIRATMVPTSSLGCTQLLADDFARNGSSRFRQTIARINLGYDIDIMIQAVAIDYFNGGGLPAK
jgi:hypothetical protein